MVGLIEQKVTRIYLRNVKLITVPSLVYEELRNSKQDEKPKMQLFIIIKLGVKIVGFLKLIELSNLKVSQYSFGQNILINYQLR